MSYSFMSRLPADSASSLQNIPATLLDESHFKEHSSFAIGKLDISDGKGDDVDAKTITGLHVRNILFALADGSDPICAKMLTHFDGKSRNNAMNRLSAAAMWCRRRIDDSLGGIGLSSVSSGDSDTAFKSAKTPEYMYTPTLALSHKIPLALRATSPLISVLHGADIDNYNQARASEHKPASTSREDLASLLQHLLEQRVTLAELSPYIASGDIGCLWGDDRAAVSGRSQEVSDSANADMSCLQSERMAEALPCGDVCVRDFASKGG